MFKFVMISMTFLVIYGCTGTHQQNIERLDEVYGCDNPHKSMSQRKYKECIAKQRAGGESLFNLTEDFDKLLGNNNDTNIIYQNSVNSYLWNASLKVTKSYPLKIADNQGGYIETDWIYDPAFVDQRCLIKIQVLSKDLITTGIDTKFLCENKLDSIWVPDNKIYSEEEKQIALKILEIAGTQASTAL